MESAKWEQIELETYERVNEIQATPNFRHFTPCLTNTTDNALKPRSIVNGMSHDDRRIPNLLEYTRNNSLKSRRDMKAIGKRKFEMNSGNVCQLYYIIFQVYNYIFLFAFA